MRLRNEPAFHRLLIVFSAPPRIIHAGKWFNMMISEQLLPTTSCVEAWTRLAGQRGGDFIVRNISDEKVTVVLADAAGHDEEAARIVEFLRPMIARQIRFPISESLIRFWHHLVQERSKDSNRFVCFTIMRLDRFTRDLTIVNAGNPDVIIRRGLGSRLDRFESTGMPLGIVEDAEWRCPLIQRTYLGINDYALCFSDGVTDCVGSGGERFGLGRVCRAAKVADGSSPLRSVRRGILRFASPTANQDDLSLLVLAGGRQVA